MALRFPADRTCRCAVPRMKPRPMTASRHNYERRWSRQNPRNLCLQPAAAPNPVARNRIDAQPKRSRYRSCTRRIWCVRPWHPKRSWPWWRRTRVGRRTWHRAGPCVQDMRSNGSEVGIEEHAVQARPKTCSAAAEHDREAGDPERQRAEAEVEQVLHADVHGVLARVRPVSTSAKPACIHMTRNAVTNIHIVSSA